MKTLLTALLFTALSLHASAQSTFTEKTLTDMRQRMLSTSWEKFSKAEVSPDFVMQGNAGKPCDMTCMEALNNTSTLVAWPMEQIKIRQAGNVAIVTGITHHSAVNKKNNVKWTANERFTETYEYKNGKWLWLTAHYTSIQASQADEEAAIKKLLVDERNAFFAGDKVKMTSFWTINPRTFVNASYSNGRHFYMNSERVQKAIADFKPSDQAIGTITDSKVYVYGNNAFANLELTANHKNGSIAKEHDLVLLEKEVGTWKVSGYSAHGIAADKQEDSAAIVKVIEKETQSWHDRNIDGRIACIANVPYALMLVHHGVMESTNGVAYVTNEKTDAPERLKTQTEGMGKPNGSTFKNENYVVTIKGGTAFASFHEITTAADGKKTYGHGVRNLEKIDGLWKLTYIGGVIYKRD